MTKELGGKITRQPGPIPGLNTKITSFLDPDGWKVVCNFPEQSNCFKILFCCRIGVMGGLGII